MTTKCPHCNNPINPAQLLASIPSEKKAAAARENGKKGGRPRTKKSALTEALEILPPK